MKCTYATLKFSLAVVVLIYDQLGEAEWLEEEEISLSIEYGHSTNSKAAGQCNIISNNSCPTLQKINSCFNPVLVTSVSCLCALHH